MINDHFINSGVFRPMSFRFQFFLLLVVISFAGASTGFEGS
jgi:hypothetical protein